jgi:DNA-binding transcriptional MerR regulator/methylmalonyl-CoA mutase cobalamin-binding subunit
MRSAGASAMHESYPLRTVTRLTGLSPDIIRAWEKRYGVVNPARGPRGARLYTSDDVAHLRLLSRVVSSGRAIGDVARLARAELERLAADPPVLAREAAAIPAADRRKVVVDTALDALNRFDSAELDRSLGEALMALGSAGFHRHIARPLLEEVGARWQDGRLSVAEEHLVSGMLRNLLAGLIRGRGPAGAPRVLLATPSGERHEFGLLLTSLTFVDAGVGVLYLGVDIPAGEIVEAGRRSGVRVVGLGFVNGDIRQSLLAEARRVERALPAEVELWLGGREARAIASELDQTRALVIDQLDTLEDEVARLRAAQGA